MTIIMLGELCVIKFQNLSNLCIEYVQKHVQKHQIETVVRTLKYVVLSTVLGLVTKHGLVCINPIPHLNGGQEMSGITTHQERILKVPMTVHI